MTAAASPGYLYERGTRLKVVSDAELDLRRGGLDDPEEFERAENEQALERWARVLELSLLFSSVHEAVTRLGLRTVADIFREFERLDALVVTLSRLDPADVLEQNAAVLAPYARLQPSAEEPATVDMDQAVRSVRSLLLHCPIRDIERLGRRLGALELAHRCRLAYDGLDAFVARHAHPRQEAITTAGQLYAEGRATIEEVAAMLALTVPDVVALLEDHGFRRSVDQLRLNDDERRKRLDGIRKDRLARQGKPDYSPSRVMREVIASQRIEGVDARPWLRR